MAVIAVLVAVAIPTFTNQLEKSRQSTDVANLRDVYAVAKLAVLNQNDNFANPSQYDPAYILNQNQGTAKTLYCWANPDSGEFQEASGDAPLEYLVGKAVTGSVIIDTTGLSDKIKYSDSLTSDSKTGAVNKAVLVKFTCKANTPFELDELSFAALKPDTSTLSASFDDAINVPAGTYSTDAYSVVDLTTGTTGGTGGYTYKVADGASVWDVNSTDKKTLEFKGTIAVGESNTVTMTVTDEASKTVTFTVKITATAADTTVLSVSPTSKSITDNFAKTGGTINLNDYFTCTFPAATYAGLAATRVSDSSVTWEITAASKKLDTTTTDVLSGEFGSALTGYRLTVPANSDSSNDAEYTLTLTAKATRESVEYTSADITLTFKVNKSD